MATRLGTLEFDPLACNISKVRRGHARAMHWCYIFVDLTLIFHFSLAFGLGHSMNPPGPSFTIALFDSSLHAAPVLVARRLHCVRVISLLLVAI